MSKPSIIDSKILLQSRIFTVVETRTRFDNGEERIFEQVTTSSYGAVLIVPVLDQDTFLLIREYAPACENYILGFPKGAINKDENILKAADRELMEEAGYGSRKLTYLMHMSLSPAYVHTKMDIVLAEDLYPKRIPGDEPEEIEVIPWKFSNIDALLKHPEFYESRSIAALLLVDRMKTNRRS